MSWLFSIEYTALRNHCADCALWEDTAWLTYYVLSGCNAVVEYLMRSGLRLLKVLKLVIVRVGD